MSEGRFFTPRGFENFATITDTHHNLISVRESSQLEEPCVWVFSRANEGIAGRALTSLHLNVSQARELAAALLAFADKVDARVPLGPDAEEVK